MISTVSLASRRQASPPTLRIGGQTRAPSSPGSRVAVHGGDEVDEPADEAADQHQAEPVGQVDAEDQRDQQHGRGAEEPDPGQRPAGFRRGERRRRRWARTGPRPPRRRVEAASGSAPTSGDPAARGRDGAASVDRRRVAVVVDDRRQASSSSLSRRGRPGARRPLTTGGGGRHGGGQPPAWGVGGDPGDEVRGLLEDRRGVVVERGHVVGLSAASAR